jgi:hypothetical protein
MALGGAAYFYPNEVVTASDSELLEIDGIGPVALANIRKVLNSVHGENLSVFEYMNRLTGEIDDAIPYPLPTRADLKKKG